MTDGHWMRFERQGDEGRGVRISAIDVASALAHEGFQWVQEAMYKAVFLQVRILAKDATYRWVRDG